MNDNFQNNNNNYNTNANQGNYSRIGEDQNFLKANIPNQNQIVNPYDPNIVIYLFSFICNIIYYIGIGLNNI
jgi:hypothetical protein